MILESRGTLRAWAEREVVAGWSKNWAAAPVFSVPVPSCGGDTDVPDRLARRGATLSARAEVTAFCTSSEIGEVWFITFLSRRTTSANWFSGWDDSRPLACTTFP